MDHKPSRLGLHAPHLTDFVLSKAKASALKRSIAAAGSRLLALLTRDPYMPGSLKDGIASTFKTTVWPQVTEFLLETLSPDQTRVKANHHREWPECLTVADSGWFWRFRCTVLYAILPADMSIWAKLRSPRLLSIYLLLLCPYFGISLWMMLLLLVCIHWRCEFQLINYIVLIRALSFITVGLSWTCQGFVKFEFCVNSLEANPVSCDESGPGASEAEMMRFAGIASKSAFVYCICRRLEPRTSRTQEVYYSHTLTLRDPRTVAYATLIALKGVERLHP